MDNHRKKSIVMQGSILAGAGLITKVIGFIYRIPMANIMGNNGNGLYSVSFGIYNIALTLSSYSMPLAVSKLLSARLAKKQFKNARRLFADAFLFALLSGLIAALILYLGASGFAAIYHKEGLERPLRILAPTVFVVALLGTCRGYYQGHRNMVPTAVSQIIEQIINAIVSVLAASAFVKMAAEGEAASYGAMGGTLGTFAGAGAAFAIFLFLLFTDRKSFTALGQGDDVLDEDHKTIMRAIRLTMLPVILSQTIYQLGYTVDDLLFGNLMVRKGFSEELTTALQGVFNTQYNQMINLPVAVATAMAAATLPSIVVSYTKGEKDKVRQKTDTVLKVNMLIAIPSAIGLAMLADPIMQLLFPGLGEHHDTAVNLLTYGSFAVVFYALSTVTTSILQGCDHMRTPVVHSAISLGIHVVIVAGLLIFTDMEVSALLIGNVTFPLCVSAMNCASLVRLADYKFKWMDAFLKPLFCACLMGAAAKWVYVTVKALISGNAFAGTLVAFALAMVTALIVYAVTMVLTGAITKDSLRRR